MKSDIRHLLSGIIILPKTNQIFLEFLFEDAIIVF